MSMHRSPPPKNKNQKKNVYWGQAAQGPGDPCAVELAESVAQSWLKEASSQPSW